MPINKKWPKFNIFFSKKDFQDTFFSEKTDLAFPTSKAAPRNGAQKKIAFRKKVAKFHIFFSEKNFQDRFFSEKTEIAVPQSKRAPRNGARKRNWH